MEKQHREKNWQKKWDIILLIWHDYISDQQDKTITDLFKEVGEEEFRKIETKALEECINDNLKALIATGGGTPCFNDNLKRMKANGKLIYLKMNAEELYSRLFNAKQDRPLIKDKQGEEMLLYIENLLKTREEFYGQADVITGGVTVDIEALKTEVLKVQ